MSEELHAIDMGGVQFVPITDLERFDASIEWDNAGKFATINIRDTTAQVFAGQTTVHADGRSIELEAEPFIQGNTLYVPAGLISSLGLQDEAA